MKLIRPITVGATGAFSRASTATYYDKNGLLQTASSNIARLSYDPTDLTVPPAWLLEAAATNLLLQSQAVDSASWGKFSATVSADIVTAPSGLVTADRLTGTSTDGACSQAFTPASTAPHTFSIWMKSSSITVFRVYVYRNSPQTFEYSTPVALTSTWQRFEFPFTPVDTSLHLVQIGGGNSLGLGQFVDLWGAQVEVGAATSYIATTGATGTRAADLNTLVMLSNIPEPDTGDPAPWGSTTSYVAGTQVRVPSTHEVFEAAAGGSIATVTFTSGNASASVNWTAHGLANGTPVAFKSSGSLPSELIVGQTYYVVSAAANTFGVSATVGGSGISLSGVGSGTHTAQPNPNYGKDPTLPANAAYWTRVGPTNRWAMFDQLSNTDSEYADVVATNIDLSERIDSLGLLNISASKARVIVTDATDGVVYDQTYSLVSTDGIDDAWAYCFEPIERDGELILEDLPPYYGSNLQIILAGIGETVSCGMCIPGLSYTLGGTQYGARVGIQDYSVKSTDEFGNIEITARSYAKRGSFSMRFPKGRTDSVVKNLTEYRTTPALWVGHADYGSTAIFGFYKDFNVLIDKLSHSLCEIEIEGLT
jgi:hypothetical protein